MKTRVVAGVVFLLGAAAGVAALLVFGGKQAPQNEAANADPKSPGPNPAGDGQSKGDKADRAVNYALQYERTAWRTIASDLKGKRGENGAEFHVNTRAYRVRRGGPESHFIELQVQYTKVESYKKPPSPSEFGLTVADAAALIAFVKSLTGKESGNKPAVDVAYVEWSATTRNWRGDAGTALTITYKYDGKFAFALPGTFASDSIGDRLPEFLAEGLKDLEKLKAVPWAPEP